MAVEDVVAAIYAAFGLNERGPFYIGSAQFELWQHTHLIIDAVPGRGGGFSLEAPEGMRFLTRSRLYTQEEIVALEVQGPLGIEPSAT